MKARLTTSRFAWKFGQDLVQLVVLLGSLDHADSAYFNKSLALSLLYYFDFKYVRCPFPVLNGHQALFWSPLCFSIPEDQQIRLTSSVAKHVY